MAKVKYNGITIINKPDEVFSGIASSFQLENQNGYLQHIEMYSLAVHLLKPSCNTIFKERHDRIQEFISYFKNNFGRLEIIENGKTVFDETVVVRSVNVSQTDLRGIVPVSIEIEVFRTFENSGVINPVDEVNADQNDSSVATVTRRISAQGVGPEALENAKAFVNARRNQNFYFSYITASHPLVKRVEREIIGLNGDYTVEQTFLYDSEDSLSPTYVSTLTYSVSITEQEGDVNITINGDIVGEISDNATRSALTQLKNRFDAINFDAIAQSEYEKQGGTGLVHPTGTRAINENAQTRTVSFSLGYSSRIQNGVYIDDTVVISEDLNNTCITYSGVIKSDTGTQAQRWQAVKTFFLTFDPKNEILVKWNKFGNGKTLSHTAQTLSTGRNEFAAEITFSITYCVNPSEDFNCFENLQYVLNFFPSIQMYNYIPALDGQGCYVLQNRSYKRRQEFEISGSANIAPCCSKGLAEFQLRSKANFLSGMYFNQPEKYLSRNDITYDEAENSINFSFRWNAAAV